MMGRQGGRGARGAAVFAVLAALAAVAAPARADTTVTDLAGLRTAVTDAAAASTDPTSSTTITLSADTIDLSADGQGPIIWNGQGTLEIAGDAAMHPVLDAGGQSRVVEVQSGTLDLEDLTVSGGHVSDDGGGVLVDGTGVLVANSAAFVGNVAGGNGGGISIHAGSAQLTNSTVSGNRAGGVSGGGGLDASGGPATLDYTTVADNVAPAATPGGVTAGVDAANSIIARNTPMDCGAALTDHQDLDSDGTCFGAGSAPVPPLGPLADNGGPTPTLALLSGGPSTDGTGCPEFDQTGFARSVVCHVGAYEFAPPATMTYAIGDAPTQTTAVVQGNVQPGHRQSFHFDYGLTAAYGSQTASQPVTGSQVSATLEGLTPATTYHFRVVVDGPDGEAQGADQSFTTATPPPVPPQVVTQIESQTVTVTVPVKPAVIEAVLLPPVLSNLRLSPTAVLPMEFGGSVARAHGARVTYTGMNSVLSKFTVDRVVRGLRHGATCARRPARSKGPSCDRFVRLRGTFTHQDVQGPNAFRFTGGLNGSRLKPGRYRLNATPRDLTGRLGSTISATFRVVRR